MGDRRSKSLIAQRFSHSAARYETVTPLQQQAAQILFDLLDARFVPRSQGPEIMDVGVGSGRLLALAETHFGRFAPKYYGVDFAPQMIEEAQHRFPEASLYCCDAETFAYQSYDLILSNFALQWCAAPLRLLERLHAALRPGGCLAVALPVRGSLAELSALVARLCGEELPLYPLPDAAEFVHLSEQFPNVVLEERSLRVAYPDGPYAALRAIKLAGAATAHDDDAPNATNSLSYTALRTLAAQPGPFVQGFQVLFIVACLPGTQA